MQKTRRAFAAPLALAFIAQTALAQDVLHRVEIVDLEDGLGLASQLETLGFDVVEGTVEPDRMELVVSPWSMTYLINQGHGPTILETGRPYSEIQQAAFDESTEMVPAGYFDLAQINAQMATLEANNPGLAKVVNLTADYGAPQTHEGRDLLGLKISDNVDVDEDELAMLVISAQHCREIITPLIAMTAAVKLLNDYGTDPATQAVVDSTEIFIVPVGNPDGYEYVFNTNNLWRKNRRDNGTGCFGVDINRNFRAGWTASCSGSTNTCSDTYKGPSGGSEPESEAVELLTAAEHFGKVLDFHSSGRETLWSYACATTPWDSHWQSTAIDLSMASGYGSDERRPSAEGEHYEWQVKRGAWAHLQETGTTFQPPFTSAQSEAAACYGAVFAMLETPIHFSGHTTDACTGAPVVAEVQFAGVTFPYNAVFETGGLHGRYDLHPPAGSYTVSFVAAGYATQSFPITVVDGATTSLDVALVPTAPVTVNYCTAGTTASGCQATLSASGVPSASASSGFTVTGSNAEGNKDGLFFFGTNGRQANPWGSSSSFQCVIPPVSRTALITGTGTNGSCDGSFSVDLNALWCATCPKPAKNPGAGATAQLQLWFRDPNNTSNQTTSLSDAIEFDVCQ